MAKVLLISTPEIRILAWRGVAQLGSAGALGALGRRFESCRPDLNLSESNIQLCERGAKSLLLAVLLSRNFSDAC